MEKQLSSPYIKNKWLYRLMQTKRDLISLIDAKDAYLHNSMEKDNPLNLSKSLIAKKMETNLDYKTINTKIK